MIGTSKRKRFLTGILTASAIGAAFCLIFHFNLFHEIQLQSSDFLFQAANLNPRADPANDIVIVAIDDKSLDQLGHFSSWPRAYHAHLIDVLADAEARIIAFDVLFSESTPDDELLVTSIKDAGNVLLPLVCTLTVQRSTVRGETIAVGDVIKPLRTFEESALGVGHANMLTDEDGIVRRLPLVIPNGESYEPALALTAAAKYLRRPQVVESSIRNGSLPLAGRSISLDKANSMLINYTGDSAAPLSFNTASYVDVLRQNTDATVFQDKIVLIGVTATGLGDTFWTPMGRMMNGVELHAGAIHTILTGNFLKPAPSSITMMSILVLALLAGLAVLRLRVLWATLTTLLLGIVYFIIAFGSFDHGIMLNMLYPPLALAGAYVGVNAHNVTSEQSEKREITRTFSRYVSPAVVDKILAASGEGELKLGGEEHEVTVMFADARGFTGISEKMQPQELVGVLNTYLSVIISSVLKYDGMINKFGGDSIMAIWNVPVACEEHALLALKASVSVHHEIRKLQEKETALPKIAFGVGINTGKAVAGNMGSQDRLEYSVIGDAVNTAARLADAAPGGRVWIGADTFAQAKNSIKAKPLAPLTVKGKQEPIQAYEILDYQEQPGKGNQSIRKGGCNKS